MPILHRTHQPAEPDTGPDPAPAPRIPLRHHEAALPARVRGLVTLSRRNRAWTASVMLLALIVFMMFWAQTTLLVALAAALAAAAAGGLLLTLMFGTGWITQRRRTRDLPRYR